MASKLEQILKCSICKRDCTDPRILPCLHSACTNCLLSEISTQKQRDKYLTCRVCGKISLVPVGDVAALPKNGMLERLKGSATSSGRSREQRCDKHPNKALSDFCDTCRVPVCPACFKTTHHGHEKRDLSVVAREAKSDMGSLRDFAKAIKMRLGENLDKLDKSKQKIDKDDRDICDPIRKTGSELKVEINKRENFLINQVEESKKIFDKAIRDAREKTESRITDVQNLQQHIHVIRTKGSDIDQVVHLPGLQDQLQQLDASPPEEVTWTVTPTSDDFLRKFLLGAIDASDASDPFGTVADSRQNALDAHHPKVFKPDVGREIGWRSRVSGLVVIGDCVYVTGYDKPYLWVENMKTNQSIQHKLKGMSAVGMAVLHSNTHTNSTLAITDWWRKLHFVTLSPQGVHVVKHKVQPILFEPRQVSVDPKTGQLVIARAGPFDHGNFVICDHEGNERKRVAKTTFFGISRVLPDGDGYLVRSTSIQWVDGKGEVTTTYLDGVRKRFTHLDRGVHNDTTFDSNGSLIATDYDNHRVHLIDADTKQLRNHVLTKKTDFRYPSRVFFDGKTQRLFVGHYDRNNHTAVSVYDWPFIPGEHCKLGLTVQLND